MPAIRDEIKQTRPFPTRSAEAVVALMRTADMVRRSVASVVEPAGITPQQYNVLRILRGAGADGIPTLAIGERLIEETPGMTRLLDRLEAKHFVKRERCPGDRRQVTCRITPAGLKLLRDLDPVVIPGNPGILGGATERDLARLIPILDRIRS